MGKIDKHGMVNLIPLARAAKMGDLAAVKVRLAHGEGPNLAFLDEKPALLLAASHGHYECVQALLNAHSYHKQNKVKQLILEARDYLSHTQQKSFKIKKGVIKDYPASFVSDKFKTIATGPYFPVAHWKEAKMIKETVEKNMEEAVQNGLQMVMIVDLKGNMNYLSYDKQEDPNKVSSLLQELIKKSKNSWDSLPLIFTNNGNTDVIEELIAMQYKKIDKGKAFAVEGIESARKNKFDLIVNYLQERQDINAIDRDGNTLLHKAVQEQDDVQVQKIISRGVDVNIKNKNGDAALDIAAKYCSPRWGKKVTSKESIDMNM